MSMSPVCTTSTVRDNQLLGSIVWRNQNLVKLQHEKKIHLLDGGKFIACVTYTYRQQVQQQAALVVQENEVLLEKLDQQDDMIDKTHEEYHCNSKLFNLDNLNVT